MKRSAIFKVPLTLNLKPLTLISERGKAIKTTIFNKLINLNPNPKTSFYERSKIMRTKVLLAGLLLGLVFAFSSATAQVPQMINYQGKLTTAGGGCVGDTTISMTFKIYADSTTPTSLWSETQSSVEVEDGIFNVLLGSVNPIPSSVFNGSTKYLGITVGGDSEMTPRKPIVSVGYAYTTENADKVDGYHAGNSSGQVALSNGTVCTNLNADKVDGYHVSDLDGRYVNEGQSNSITSGMVVDNTIAQSDIATNGVGSAEIASDAVGASEIASGAVGSSEISDNSITQSDIATNGVGSAEIAADAVGSSEIAANAVGASEIASDAVGRVDLASTFKAQYVRVHTGTANQYIWNPDWYNDSRPAIRTTGTAGQLYIYDPGGGVSCRVVIKEDGTVVYNGWTPVTYNASDGKLIEIYVWPYTFIYQWYVHFTGARERYNSSNDHIAGLVRAGTD